MKIDNLSDTLVRSLKDIPDEFNRTILNGLSPTRNFKDKLNDAKIYLRKVLRDLHNYEITEYH